MQPHLHEVGGGTGGDVVLTEDQLLCHAAAECDRHLHKSESSGNWFLLKDTSDRIQTMQLCSLLLTQLVAMCRLLGQQGC